ncbi:hypothetical protein HA402_011140 [Bradysia odoriphaga]|nr:hypothetical protein HA402_011140 [Bradysia odoriphaga]
MVNIKETCKTKARGFVTDPKKLVRYVVLLICCVVVIFQLSECFTKLYRPPITTHSHFDLNESVSYPAITFCRDPPYKEDVLRSHNLSYHPRFSNSWRNFDFNSVDLDDLFENATYGKSEFFGQYGLDGLADNVAIVSGIYFNYGQCHTMTPKVTTRRSWKNHGYSLILTHTMEATDETTSENVPGWHVFIHEPKENFTVQLGVLTFASGLKLRNQLDVQVFEERPNYDLAQFVADMGGSLGFLLGLSVLGLIKILEKIVSLIFGNYIKKHQEKAEQAKLDKKQQSINKECDLSSTSTLELPAKLLPNKHSI